MCVHAHVSVPVSGSWGGRGQDQPPLWPRWTPSRGLLSQGRSAGLLAAGRGEAGGHGEAGKEKEAGFWKTWLGPGQD